jgi:VWFA-related protein
MRHAGFLVTAGAIAALLASGHVAAQQPQQLPRFTSAVDVTELDASVFDQRGAPVTDLKADDFVVRVDGQSRQVVSAEWIPLSTPDKPATVAPQGYSSNESSTGGRLILIVIDQPNIRFGGTMAIRKAVNGFIDGLQPADRAAIVGIGPGSPSTPFTPDRARLKKAVERMVGQYRSQLMTMHNITLSEALDVRNQIPGALDRIINRECRDMGNNLLDGPALDVCISEVDNEAQQQALEQTTSGSDTISTLRALLSALKGIEAPKTMVFVSEGFLTDGQYSAVTELGAIAAAARTSIYALRLDDDAAQMSAESNRIPLTRLQDRTVRSEGLEILASSSRGSLFNIVGDGTGAFQRIERELAGYYLLGVTSAPSDRDGKVHPIRVEVSRRGVQVRARRALYAPPDLPPVRNPRQAVAAAIAAPLPLSALPLRVATFSLLGPESGKVQMLIHADVGTDYSASKLVALAYTISDPEGRIVETQAATARLTPVMTGVPSSLQFTGGASLPPGDYILKLAVAESDRVGTVEHMFRAEVAAAGKVRYSDLMVGGPNVAITDPLQPSVGYQVIFGSLQGYVEAYGQPLGPMTAKYEVAKDAAGDALIASDVTPVTIGGTRAIFTKVLPVRQLPPGKYVLRAKLSSPAEPVRTMIREFEVAAPAVLMTSAVTSGDIVLPATDVFLPVPETLISGQFDPALASGEATVRLFRDRVPASLKPAFDAGVQALTTGAYRDAEQHFKEAITADEDSSAVLAYLAATYAAAGHDAEASSAWQTSLIDGSEFPQIYEWLSGALLRTRNLPQARGTLEEAVAKWPSDERFSKPLAIMYAMYGEGVQAVRALDRYLAVHGDDLEALQLGVEWIYQLRQSNAAALSRAEDARMARRYADRYIAANGPQAPLVKQWIEYIEQSR